MEEGGGSNTGSPVGGAHIPTGTPRGAGRAGRVADGLVVPRRPGNAGGGKEPWFESDTERGEGVTTGESLEGSEKVRKLQTVLHAKAKEEPDRRFHSLIDKVWREDFLAEAWRRVRRNGGSAGVDEETFADIGSYGVERWLGELARELREGTYTPKPVRQVLIPKKQPGKFRPLGIPCIRDRVAQTSALLVLGPIFEADLRPEQYAYRPGRSAHDAVRRVHSLLNTGHNEVVDCDLSNYFGEIPHVELLKSVARRVSDGRMLGLIKAWLEMPVEEDDGKGGKRRTNRARRERKGTPQGSPISPLVSNLYMRRFILGLECAGPRPALPCGDRELCRRPVCAWQDPGGGNADGGRAADGGSEAPGQRTENPMPAVPGGASGVSGLPHRTQLPSLRGKGPTSAPAPARQASRASAAGSAT